MLFPSKKPKWQHSDPAVRLTAIEAMDHSEADELAMVALNDVEPAVRLAAVNKLEDFASLDRVAAQSVDPRVVERAVEKGEEKRAALLREEGDLGIHLQYLDRINSPAKLIFLACTSFHIPVRLRCVARLNKQGDLEQAAMGQCGSSVAEALVERLHDPEILARLSLNGGSKTVRRLSQQKLRNLQEPDSTGEEEQVQKKVQEIVENAARLSSSLEWDLTRQRLDQLQGELEELGGAYHDRLAEQFQDAVDGFNKRYADHLAAGEKQKRQREEIGDVKARFAEILQQIRQLSSPGSGASPRPSVADYCSKAEELLPKLPAALREELHLQLASACREFGENQTCYETERRKAEQLESRFKEKKETIQNSVLLLEELQSLSKAIEREDWRQYLPVSLKKKIDSEKISQTALLEQSRAAEQQQKELAAEKLSRLIREVEELGKAKDMTAAMSRFREIDAGSDAAAHAAADCPPELNQRYRAARARFLVRQRDFFAFQEWHLWANRNIKEKLIEETIVLEELDDAARLFAGLKQLQARWKETGSAGSKQDRQLWLRFHQQCEKLFSRCLPYLDELEKKRQIQIERFNTIIEEAKGLSGSTAWQTTARQFQAWQGEIKEFTEIPASIRNELHLLFRKEANAFFERKRLNRSEIERQQQRNYQLKEQLCLEAEKLAAAPAPGLAVELRKLQNEWKGIAPVARKKEQQLWQRFRKACDQYFHGMDEDRQKNLAQKQVLVEKAAAIALQAETVDDFRPLAAELVELKDQWKAIGPVPKAESQPLWDRFRSEVERFYTIRKQSLATLNDEKRENQRRKEGILEDIEKLADSIHDREATEKIKDLQKQFNAIGPSPKGEDQRLRERLRALCDNFFKGRSNYFSQLREHRKKVLQEKEALLFELQQLVNYTPKANRKKEPRTLDLAAQLKLALESNFAMADRDKKQARREEMKRIQKRWNALDNLPFKQEKELQQRYQEVLDFFERQKRS